MTHKPNHAAIAEYNIGNEVVTLRDAGTPSTPMFLAEIRIVIKKGGAPEYFNAADPSVDGALRALSNTLYIVADVMICLNPYPWARYKDVKSCASALSDIVRGRPMTSSLIDSCEDAA